MASEIHACTLLSVLVIALVAVNQANTAMTMEQIEKTAMSLRNTCANKVNANLDLVAGIQKGEFPDDRALKCYTLCIMKMMRTFKNGRVDDGMLIKQVDLMMPADFASHIKEVARICSMEPPTGDDCETTFNFVKCNYKTDKDYFFFP